MFPAFVVPVPFREKFKESSQHFEATVVSVAGHELQNLKIRNKYHHRPRERTFNMEKGEKPGGVTLRQCDDAFSGLESTKINGA